jgi:hypothetical protein
MVLGQLVCDLPLDPDVHGHGDQLARDAVVEKAAHLLELIWREEWELLMEFGLLVRRQAPEYLVSWEIAFLWRNVIESQDLPGAVDEEV